MKPGRVLSLHTAPSAGQPMTTQREVRAAKGIGLAGDRYALRLGTYSKKPGPDREITLFASETLAALQRETGIVLAPAETRRNVVTEGVDLANLYGKPFRVGEVTLQGVRECEPCGYLQELTGKAVFKPLQGRGGLRAIILTSGTLRVGDAIEALPEAEATAAVPARH